MNSLSGDVWPAWLVVAVCALVTQLIKLVAYSLTQRRLAVAALGQVHGLPSSQAAVLGCLLVLVILRHGWDSSAAAFALVFAVIVIHDTIKLRVAASRHREAVLRIVESLHNPGPFRQRVADYLDPRTHHPAHVVVGVVVGGLFALAFGAA
jgi:acid phosphatase family membrane protein YuiD